MRNLLRCLALLGASLPHIIWADPESRPAGIAARIWGTGNITSGQPGDFSLSGTYLDPDPSVGGTLYRSASTSTSSGGALTTNLGASTNGIVRVEPSKVYQLIVGGQNLGLAEINILPPPGYRTIIDGIIRTRFEFSGGYLFYFQLEPIGAPRPEAAGASTNVDSGAVEWQSALGELSNGQSAGVLSLVDSGTRSSWSPLFTPSMLNYETSSAEVWVYRVSGNLRQIISKTAALDIVTVNSTNYELKYYHPDQVNYSNTPRTFTGSPFVTYKITQGGTSTTLSFTKELRDVTSTTSTFSVSRTEVMSLARTNSWPDFIWTRSPWTLQGQTAVSETLADSGGSGTTRSTEDITVKPPGGSATVEVERTFTNYSGVGEFVTSETFGSSSHGLVTNYAYYTNTSNPGELGGLKSTTYPGGGWEAFEYYDPTSSVSSRAGKIKYRFRPFANSPSSVTQNPAQGEVTYFEYVNDEYGSQRNPSLIKTKINDVETARTTFAYTYDVWYPNSHAVNRIERADYTNSTTSLTTTLCVYRSDWGDPIYRGQVFAITTPDGVRKAYAYETGTWSSGAFTAGSGTASRISEITGSSNSSAGSSMTSHNSKTIEQVYVVDGKSTLVTTVRDSQARLVRRETAVRSSSAWQTTGWTNFTYDMAGHLTNRSSSNAATYEATYTGGLKTNETDEQGVVTDYTYDSGDRLETVTRQGSGVIGTLVYKYTYDAAGNRTEERLGYGQSEQIITAAQFDDAGRLTSISPPGLGATTHSYNVSARTHTITRADSATLIETANLDGELASVTGTAVVPQYRTYAIESDGSRYSQVNSGTTSSARWLKKWTNWMGRGIKQEHPGFTGQDNMVEQYFYDSVGRLSKSTRSGYAARLFEYGSLSNLYRSGLDIDGNNVLDLASSDRITETNTYLESYSSAYWLRTDTKVYARLSLNTVFTTDISRVRLTQHASNRLAEAQQIDAESNTRTAQYEVNRLARTATTTETHSGLSGSRTSSFVNGILRSTTSFDGLTTTLGYDGLLRFSTNTDSRSNTTTVAYASGTARASTVTDASSAQQAFTYDNVGRLTSQRDARNFYTRFAYNNRNQITRQWGDGAYPVEYGYDSTYGDLLTMGTFRGGSNWDGTSWPSSPGTADTTTWAYDGPSGMLGSTVDAQSRTTSYAYNVRGQASSRTLARGVSAAYSYSSYTGELLGIDYSDSTPDVSFTYTRMGQLDSATDTTGTRDFVYDTSKPWRLTAEALDSFYGSKVITRLYESSGMVGRVDGLQLGSTAGSSSDLEHNFSFATNGRFETITSGINSNATTRTFRYGYLSNSALLQSLSIDGGHAFTVTRSHASTRDLVTSIDSKWSTTSRVKYDFAYDERQMRTSLVQSGDVFADYGDSTHRIFTYNGRGELTADVGYMNGTATSQTDPLPGRRYEFTYDNSGNRITSNRNGTALPAEQYTTNSLNQYVTRENNTLPVSGTANTDSNVAVKGQTAGAGRKGKYWADEVVVNNAVRPWWGTLVLFTAKPGGGGGGSDLYRSDSRTAFLAAALQSFTYDHDGNLTSDGVWDYGYDAENRLIWMQTTSNALTYGFPNRVLQFKYDFVGRRVQKRVINGGTSAEISSRRYVYDGWNLVAEYEAPSGTSLGSIVRSYTWGLDIVTSLGGAGGVGALLQITDHSSGKTFLPTYDGNGNITALLNGSSGAVGATYEYSPFGETVRAQVTDSVLAEQPFRFSTKFTDVETGLVYYGLRYYEPRNGRFINRDPIGAAGGLNLYGFCGNNGVNRWDLLGMIADGENEVVPYGDGLFLARAKDPTGILVEHGFTTHEDANNWGYAWSHYWTSTVNGLHTTDAYDAAAEAHNNPTPEPAPAAPEESTVADTHANIIPDARAPGDYHSFVAGGVTWTFVRGWYNGGTEIFTYSNGNGGTFTHSQDLPDFDENGNGRGSLVTAGNPTTLSYDGVSQGIIDAPTATSLLILAHNIDIAQRNEAAVLALVLTPISVATPNMAIANANGALKFTNPVVVGTSDRNVTFSAEDLNYAAAVIYGEAKNNPIDQYAVASVLWNRIGATGVRGGVATTFTDVANAPNQFEAVGGTKFLQALNGTPASIAEYNSALNQLNISLGDFSGRAAIHNYDSFVNYPRSGYVQLVPGGNYFYDNPGIITPQP